MPRFRKIHGCVNDACKRGALEVARDQSRRGDRPAASTTPPRPPDPVRAAERVEEPRRPTRPAQSPRRRPSRRIAHRAPVRSSPGSIRGTPEHVADPGCGLDWRSADGDPEALAEEAVLDRRWFTPARAVALPAGPCPAARHPRPPWSSPAGLIPMDAAAGATLAAARWRSTRSSCRSAGTTSRWPLTRSTRCSNDSGRRPKRDADLLPVRRDR